MRHPTPRQVEILGYIAFGWTDKEIAKELGLSLHTVKTHVEQVRQRLGARSRAHAVAIVLRTGMLAAPLSPDTRVELESALRTLAAVDAALRTRTLDLHGVAGDPVLDEVAS